MEFWYTIIINVVLYIVSSLQVVVVY